MGEHLTTWEATGEQELRPVWGVERGGRGWGVYGVGVWSVECGGGVGGGACVQGTGGSTWGLRVWGLRVLCDVVWDCIVYYGMGGLCGSYTHHVTHTNTHTHTAMHTSINIPKHRRHICAVTSIVYLDFIASNALIQ